MISTMLWLAAMAAPMKPVQAGYEAGVSLRVYDIAQPMTELPELVPGQTPNVDRRIESLRLTSEDFLPLRDRFFVVISGEIRLDGTVNFRLTSDDGSVLRIADRAVISNDGVHAPVAANGSTEGRGWTKFEIRYFENEGGEELNLEWKPVGAPDFAPVPVSALRTPSGVTRVTSPGPKLIRGGGPMRPGNGLPLDRVNPAWRLETIRPADWEPKVGALAFDAQGNLLVSTFEPNQGGRFLPELRDGKILRLKDGQPQLVAEDLQEPLGMLLHRGDLYVAQRSEITRLRDADGDGRYEVRETVARGWGVDNYHHFTFGLVERDGWIYGALSTTIGNGRGINGPNPLYRGSTFRFHPDRYDPARPANNIEYISSGHRTPNGIGFGPGGDLFVTENQGAWQPANKLNVVRPGGFYGHVNEIGRGGLPGVFDHQPFQPPAVYIPQNEAGNSPTQPLLIPNGPFAGQMFVGDVKYGGLSRVFLERVDGEWQGGLVHSTHMFEAGTNRLLWGPNGELYVGMIGASETWGWTDPKTGKETRFGLQRLTPTGKTAFEIHRVEATATGFRVHFTEPIRPNSANDRTIGVRSWRYEPTPDYGGPKVDPQTNEISQIRVARDGKSVEFRVRDFRPDRVYAVTADVTSRRNEPIWAARVWYTLNRLPRPQAKLPTMNLLVFSRTAGFRHDSIETGIKAIQALGAAHDFRVTATEDPSVFNAADLKDTNVVVFLNTTGDVLNAEQQAAFEAYVRRGGGYVGVHAASDTEYDWPFYGELVGAYFQSHPPGLYEAEIRVEQPNHPTMKAVPNPWRRVDEWYDFRANPRPNVTVLASLVTSSYGKSGMGEDHPIIWCHERLGGRAWYTGLGHTKESFDEVLFLEHLKRGILWAGKRL